MTQYVGCDHARDLLEGLIDGELSMVDQLAVESHLRWCRTCALRIEDLRLIGESLREGSAAKHTGRETERTVIGISDAVLMRVRAERAQSWGVRFRDTFSDMRLFWPAIGATAAVAVCVMATAGVLQATSIHRDASLASLITTLANPAPLRPAENGFFGISIPRPNQADAERTGRTLDALPDDDVIYTVRTVVDGDGRVSNLEVLLSGGNTRKRRGAHAGHDRAVLDAIAQTRFAAAHTALGQPVAFDMVWVIAKTTAVVPAIVPAAPLVGPPTAVKVVDVPPPAAQEPVPAVNPRSSTHRPFSRLRRSATA
jgi:hypothetical protein